MARVDCREVLRLNAQGLSRRKIAESLSCSRDPVKRILNRAEQKSFGWEQAAPMTPKEVEQFLFPERSRRGNHAEPDYEHIHEALGRRGVTLTLLHEEYCEECRRQSLIPYGYTQYRNKYAAYAQQTKATLRLVHKPGDVLEVDWAGDTMEVACPGSGTVQKVHLFVACLPCSQLLYAEAFPDMKTESWLTAHVHALEYIGGVPASFVPDNLKTGVTKHTSKELIIAPAYRDLAEYYGTAVVPTRVRAPRDKASVERSVGICETWITARLRNEQHVTLTALNENILHLVDELNAQPFQKRNGSRRSVFEAEERSFLKPLPEVPYEIPIWKSMKIMPDYLIEAEGCKYSVPHGYIGCEVRIRIRRSTVDVFYEGLLIASHVRRAPQREPVYNPEHMPEKHRKALRYTEDHCRQWAHEVGGSTAKFALALLARDGASAQKINACMALARLGDRFSLVRLEKACAAAIAVGDHTPGVSTIELMLKNGREELALTDATAESTSTSDGGRGFTRGADYYRKKGLNK